MNKDNFISNPKNKQRFLLMLSEALQNLRCVTREKCSRLACEESQRTAGWGSLPKSPFIFTPSLDDTQHRVFMELARQQPEQTWECTILKRARYCLHLSFCCFWRCHYRWKAHVSLFGGKPRIGLNSLRYQAYFEKLGTKTSHIELQDLPPTAAVAVYLHAGKAVAGRRCRHVNTVRFTNYQVFPVATDLQLAPESLLHLIRCNCSSECSSMRCNCRKNSLQFFPAFSPAFSPAFFPNKGKHTATIFEEQENEKKRKYNRRDKDVEMETFTPLSVWNKRGHGTRLSELFKNSRK